VDARVGDPRPGLQIDPTPGRGWRRVTSAKRRLEGREADEALSGDGRRNRLVATSLKIRWRWIVLQKAWGTQGVFQRLCLMGGYRPCWWG
jgi:hypothetical protein